MAGTEKLLQAAQEMLESYRKGILSTIRSFSRFRRQGAGRSDFGGAKVWDGRIQFSSELPDYGKDVTPASTGWSVLSICSSPHGRNTDD